MDKERIIQITAKILIYIAAVTIIVLAYGINANYSREHNIDSPTGASQVRPTDQ